MSKRFNDTVNIRNRQATFQFEILDKYVAGLVLTGTEIKSIREGKANLTDGYCYFKNGELYVKGMSISPYAEGTYYNHDPLRERKLLMKRSELRKLEGKLEKGLTLVPLRLFINERGYAKLEIALARGKKMYDKRQTIKEREARRELNRIKW
ncbi:MAG: SsrA-binding protein [Cyclobacteriaceae bacterium]|nr:MAG: SsrA-binding protein [Cyclobacteriaceae bacterium]